MGKNGIYNVAFDNSSEEANVKSKPKNGASSNVIAISKGNNNLTKVESNDDEPERTQWGNSLEFLMSCISVSVGLGNIWRFPFTAYENGGGAFLIPYVIVLLLIGKPIYYMEMALGQFTSKGSVKALTVIPVMKGVGIGQQIATTCVVTYYCSLIALTLFFMIKSFAAQLPWAHCWEKWAELNVNCIDAASTSGNRTHAVSSSELYFIHEVIKQTNDISGGIGMPDWQLALWLLLAWISVFIVIVKGVKSSGKFAYFLAIFPYVVIFILLVRGLTLEGAWDGIKFFITPDFKRLIEPQVWLAAVTQCFFSLATGMGSIIMFASYNNFKHNMYRDAMIVTTLDTFTSLLGGFTIFGILGNLAHNVGETDISNVIKSGGSGLAFISYPDAISKFTFVPQLFAVLFFFMLFVLGVGSAVGLQSSIVSNLLDVFPKAKYWQMAGICCSGGFLVGLIYITPGGQWMLTLVDHFGGTFLIFVLAILQLVGIMWIYGIENFCWDVEFMLNRRVTLFWRLSWFLITPLMMIVIFVYSMVKLENPTYMSKQFPTPCIVAGWAIFAFGMAQIIIWAIWMVSRRNFEEKSDSAVKYLFKLNPEWGPHSPKIRKEWISYKAQKIEARRVQSLDHSKLKQVVWMLLGKYS